MRLSAYRLKKALIDLENRVANTSLLNARAVRLNRERLNRDANAIETQIAAIEADTEASADTSFVAPDRDSVQRSSLPALRRFIDRLRTRVDAVLAEFAVLSISPATGTDAGGTAVQINGVGFDPAATVTVGGSSATSVVWVSATKLTAVTPSGTAGAQDVVVTNPGAVTATLVDGFTYT